MINFNKISGNTKIGSAPAGVDSLLFADLINRNHQCILHICIDDKRLSTIANQINFFNKEINVIKIPAWDILPYDRISPSANIAVQRIESLSFIANKIPNKTVIITTVNSILQKIPPANSFKNFTFKAKKGDNVKRDDLINYLIKSSYHRATVADEAGDFAVRGSIIDIIPSGSETGLRLDFFGDEIDSIKEYDPITQITKQIVEEINLVPASEVVIEDNSINLFRIRYRDLFGQVVGDDPLYDAISEGRQYPAMENKLPLFYEKLETIFDYLPDNAIVSFDHLAYGAIKERIDVVKDYYNARLNNNSSGFAGGENYRPLPPDMLYLDEKPFYKKLANFKNQIKFSPFSSDSEALDNVVELNCKKSENLFALAKSSKKNVFELLGDCFANNSDKKKIISCVSEGTRQRMKKMLSEYDIITKEIDEFSQIKKVNKNIIALVVADFSSGFVNDDLLLFSEEDILGDRIGSKKRKSRKTENMLTRSSSLKEGELVVHSEHGLGKFQALETLSINNKRHDCLLIIYDGGDKLYVPVENIELLSRYGANDDQIKLDKLGGGAWQARKAKFKRKIMEIASDLMEIAAKRKLKYAPKMFAMNGVYDEFCARFPYAETDDQLQCIEDITNDLASGKPMDRLICGDVGFGKTEVALRAAFIAASDNQHRQVALVAPTTLLARQHYKTFKERFAGFPFNVKALSRLTPAKEAKEVKAGIADGTVDIVIGTHALLANSLSFKNLGLLIIDEEQQFGVKQKERLKKLSSDLHLLTLSATPIPRTMQMSLTGIKDLSLIATPPVDRLMVRSFIMSLDPVVVRNALLREHYRGGSSFFVVPRLKDLDEIKSKLEELVPELKLVAAHGQMPANELDTTMNDFYDGKYDVLLATNIIGSGLDLPTANTIIIYRADMFGLSQLYQMRGRVGRSKVRAYAYFTTLPNKIPTKSTVKRLEVMQNIDSLGAGFTIASHDMDIRGFGNMVGEDQSGKIKEVGVELYQQMLSDAIENIKATREEGEAKAIEDSWSPNINVGVSVLIPESYIKELELRLNLYRKIADANDDEEIDNIESELVDRFGKFPHEVENLLQVMKIKNLCKKLSIAKVETGPKGIVLGFYKNQCPNPEAILNFVSKNNQNFKIRPDQSIFYKKTFKDSQNKIKECFDLLERLKDFL